MEIWGEQQHLEKLFPTLEYKVVSRHLLAFIYTVKTHFNEPTLLVEENIQWLFP